MKGVRNAKPCGGTDRLPAAPAFDRTPFLAAVMRHELYGPLNTITMIAGLVGERARRGQIDAAELSRLSERVLKQIERATRIVDHYVELLGPTSSDDDDDATSSADELRGALEAASASGGRTEIRMNLATLPADLELALDPERLRFALGCVVAYATGRATPAQPVTLTVAPDDGGYVTLDIRYPGGPLGIDDLHVFERGALDIEPDRVALAVARRMVTDAGGEFAPRAGQIVVRLPRAME